jgi:hypothetical protein
VVLGGVLVARVLAEFYAEVLVVDRAKVRGVNAYIARLQYAATKDPKVTEGFMRVADLLDPPQALMRPQMLRHPSRRPAPSRPLPATGRSSDVGASPSA